MMRRKWCLFLLVPCLLCLLSFIVYDQLQKAEIALKIDRHWPFLDEMEAPVWADLIVEAEGNDQGLDDGWFITSHMYHEWRYLEAKAVFDCPGYGCGSSGININLRHLSQYQGEITTEAKDKRKLMMDVAVHIQKIP